MKQRWHADELLLHWTLTLKEQQLVQEKRFPLPSININQDNQMFPTNGC